MTGAEGFPIAVLGPVLAAGRNGRVAELSGVLAKRLLAALALAPGNAASAGALTDAIWGDVPPRNPRAALQTLVSRMRTELADGLLLSTPTGYAVPSDAVDLVAATRATAGSGADPVEVAARCSAALALWRGAPGGDLGDAPVAEDLAETAQHVAVGLRRVRAEACIEAGDPASALADLAILAELLPFDERVQLLRLRALAGSGRRTEALAAFAAYRGRLADALGTDPGRELVDAHAALLQDGEPAPASRIGLRHPATQLLGREDDVAAVLDLVAASRITTVLGPGGLGKTRLAQEVARRSPSPAVVFVELAGVRDEADVPIVVASTLGIVEARLGRRNLLDPSSGTTLSDRIGRQLRERPTLLVLDNCEHLVGAVAAWTAEAVQSVPDLRVLTTSRSPLAIAGERVYPLEPLASSGESGPAVDLFLERATAVRPSAVLDRAAVVRICTRLDGLPLAIELAAARVRSMSVEEIEERLGQRFSLLAAGDRTAPERHRTLQAVIEWSWRLLSPREQEVLRRVSLFADGFSAEGAAAVAGGDATAELDALVQQSLLQVREDAPGRHVRYRMLETVREYGELALAETGDEAAVRDALRAWATAFCEQAAALLRAPDTVEVIRRIETEQENLLAILRRAFDERDGATALVMFGALGTFWTIRGAHDEVLKLAPALLTVDRDFQPTGAALESAADGLVVAGATLLAARVHVGLRLLVLLRRITEGRELDPPLAGRVRLALLSSRREAFLEELARQRSDANPAIAAFALVISGQFEENEGNLAAAVEHSRKAFEIAGRTGSTWGRAMAAQALANLASEMRRPEEVLHWAAISREGMAAISASADLVQIDWLIALAQIGLGRFGDARSTLQSLLPERAAADGDVRNADAELRLMLSTGLADLAGEEGDPDGALARFGSALSRGEGRGAPSSPWHYLTVGACLARSVLAGYDRWSEEDAAWFADLARRLRSHLLAESRLRPGVVDRPVLGGALAGYGTWLAGRPGAAPAERVRGSRLLALGRVLHARQDVASLALDRLEALLEEAAPAEFAAAREQAAALSVEEATARARELLGERPA
ncbi:ATP-binding protein [Naasia aerilata]|uniref:SARP family transcriptional regulator n=1 Tax=Naasia aerilata TaxID=1162966 RepID=A0ABM8G971_9MICO|nr:BTAD domain-containing putative transcriptional regulator [Naasia aerilata]BDZ44741.1 SARP family transcriptional regulator [Naasia aerilata]